jgi:hypothetical protein
LGLCNQFAPKPSIAVEMGYRRQKVNKIAAWLEYKSKKACLTTEKHENAQT